MIRVLALLCSIAAPDQCAWRTVTTSDLSEVTLLGCQMGMPQLSVWMRDYPGYRLSRRACQFGDRERING